MLILVVRNETDRL